MVFCKYNQNDAAALITARGAAPFSAIEGTV
jgi:hypothetical protein